MEANQDELNAAGAMTMPDVILPSQYFGTIDGLGAEQRLMLAVLVDAINLLQGWNRLGSVTKRRAFAEASQWVNRHGTSHPFSFDSICDALGIGSEFLRIRLSGLTAGYGSSANFRSGRLRLKESGRAQRMTANRVRRRKGATAGPLLN